MESYQNQPPTECPVCGEPIIGVIDEGRVGQIREASVCFSGSHLFVHETIVFREKYGMQYAEDVVIRALYGTASVIRVEMTDSEGVDLND